MKRKGPASLRGSLIARKGEASPSGGVLTEKQHLRESLSDALIGRPPVSVPTPPGVVEGRLGYRLQAGSREPRLPAGVARVSQNRHVELQRADCGANSIGHTGSVLEVSHTSECSDGANTIPVADTPDYQPRRAAAMRSRVDATKSRSLIEDVASVRPAGAGAANQNANGVIIQRASEGNAGSSKSTPRHGRRQGDSVRLRSRVGADGAGSGRQRSRATRGYHPRSRTRKNARLVLFGAVVLLAVGVGYYGRLGAPQQMAQAVRETLTNAFGSAAPLLAAAVGVSEGALVGEAEVGLSTTAANRQPESLPDRSAGAVVVATDLRSVDGATVGALTQPVPLAAWSETPVSADVATVALAAVPRDAKAGVLPDPVDADKLPIPLTVSRAGAAIDTFRLPVLQASEPVPAITVRLEAPLGLAIVADVVSLPKAAVVEAPISTEVASSISGTGIRLGVLSGRAAIPISKPLDRARRKARDSSTLSSAGGAFAVQLASYRSSGLATDAAAKLSEKHLEQLGSGAARVVPGPNGLFRVMSERMEQRGDAVSLCDRLKTRGQDCLVVQR